MKGFPRAYRGGINKHARARVSLQLEREREREREPLARFAGDSCRWAGSLPSRIIGGIKTAGQKLFPFSVRASLLGSVYPRELRGIARERERERVKSKPNMARTRRAAPVVVVVVANLQSAIDSRASGTAKNYNADTTLGIYVLACWRDCANGEFLESPL